MVALLATSTVRKAAEVVGISEATMYRYMRDELFLAELRRASQRQLDSAAARLTGLLGAAVDVLGLDLLPGAGGAVRLRAADLVLRHGVKLREIGDLEKRVGELEKKNEPER